MSSLSTSEKKRLQELASYDILTEDIQDQLDHLTELASCICETPISLINLLDAKYQITKSSQGWNIDTISRESSFCQYTIEESDFMIVEDAKTDERFRNSPYVKTEPNIRFYAGVPLCTENGYNLGAICVIDNRPRTLSDEQERMLKLLAKEAVSQLELIKNKKQLEKQNKELRKADIFIKNSSDIQAIIDSETLHILEVNSEAFNEIGGNKEDFIGKPFGNRIADKEMRSEILSFLKQKEKTSSSFTAPVKRKDGSILYLEHTFSLHNGKWFMTARDITQRQKAQQKLKNEKRLSNEIINSLPTMFFMFDENQNPLRWNDMVTKVTKLNDQQIAYSDPLDFFPEEHKQYVQTKIERLFSGTPVTLETELLTADNNKIPFLLSAVPFTRDANTYMIGTGLDISELKEYQEQLKNSLSEKEVLLKEIHHRVKNNLAVILSLLQLEEFTTGNKQVQQVLRSSQLRIQSMATVHEILYNTEDLSTLPFKGFVSKIISSTQKIYDESSTNISFDLNIGEVKLNINQAIPCGLIISELITIAYDNAEEGSKEQILGISLTIEDRKVILAVNAFDNILSNAFSENQETSYTLIQTLIQQLDATIDIQPNNDTSILITFTKNNNKGSSSTIDL
ncbi:histidine kinase dimerization/phosphoacceptor domain -containing protein [Fodinibius saliphilus]|uniref:histidine kinase dimerization/phosphoacceptor domain -containing protein n=1 Tax=Fodinibius saliphilus TaxID=1920650 RepID=UPI001108924A|nr:histidine kinase dimerization/phosphoacceptor domain -containing protein [Fodinibius saliphilus]